MNGVNEYSFPPAEVRRLKQREWILTYVPEYSVGAELGVFRGHFSKIIARKVLPRKLYLVDMWTLQGSHYGDYGDYTNYGKLPTSVALEETIKRTLQYQDQTEIVIVESKCEDFLYNLEEQLDFVYLDTYHTFNETLSQLSSISKKLKPDGLILGDDWWPDRDSPHHGVFLAIHAFIKANPFEIVACGPYGQYCLRRVVTS